MNNECDECEEPDKWTAKFNTPSQAPALRGARTVWPTAGAVLNEVFSHGCGVDGIVGLGEEICNRLCDAAASVPYDVKLVKFCAALA